MNTFILCNWVNGRPAVRGDSESHLELTLSVTAEEFSCNERLNIHCLSKRYDATDGNHKRYRSGANDC